MDTWLIYVGPADHVPAMSEFVSVSADPTYWMASVAGLAGNDANEGRDLAARMYKMRVGDSDQVRTEKNTVAGVPGVVRAVRVQ